MTRQTKIWALWFLLLVLNVFDWQATEIILLAGGAEANPLQNKIIADFGTPGIMYLKAPFLLAIAIILMLWHKLHHHTKRTMEIGLAVCVGIYSLLAVWHCALMITILHRMGY